MRLYKVVGPEGQAIHGGSGTWPLPTDSEPGEWWDLGPERTIAACVWGLHLTDRAHLRTWAACHDAAIYRAEYEGEPVNGGNKWVVRKARLLPNPVSTVEFLKALNTAANYPRPLKAAVRLLADLKLPKGHVLEAKVEAARAKVGRYYARVKKVKRQSDAGVEQAIDKLFAEAGWTE